MAWYNKYRPQSFEDVVGQKLVKTVLQNAIAKDMVKHAYLFSGSKGVGKTTLARIFANQLNEVNEKPESKTDIIEMDAASNTGVDDIRMLKDAAEITPVAGKYKIFIIDEVHMLSKSAMNALLKTLEEPPEYLIFLLATTDPQKLLPTVLSRLTKLNLTSHSIEDLTSRLKHIASAESMTIDDGALKVIANAANGSQRDSINLLETAHSYGLDEYTAESVAGLFGMGSFESIGQLVEWVNTGEGRPQLVESLRAVTIDANGFLAQALSYCLDQSLEGAEGYDKSIELISKVISMRLPITDLAAMVALLEVYNNSETSTETTKKKVVKAEAPVKPKLIEQLESKPVQNKNVSKPEVKAELSTEEKIAKMKVAMGQAKKESQASKLVLEKSVEVEKKKPEAVKKEEAKPEPENIAKKVSAPKEPEVKEVSAPEPEKPVVSDSVSEKVEPDNQAEVKTEQEDAKPEVKEGVKSGEKELTTVEKLKLAVEASKNKIENKTVNKGDESEEYQQNDEEKELEQKLIKKQKDKDLPMGYDKVKKFGVKIVEGVVVLSALNNMEKAMLGSKQDWLKEVLETELEIKLGEKKPGTAAEKSGSMFYEVYRELPENMVGGKVGCYEQEIPPAPEEVKKVEEGDENIADIEDFFELED